MKSFSAESDPLVNSLSMCKPFKLLFFMLFIAAGIPAGSIWQPSPGHKQIPIWSGQIPDARKMDGPEVVKTTAPPDVVAGRPYLSGERVAIPTMTVYEPKDKPSGTAIIVFPGGGYEILAMDLEGTEVCDWLVTRSIACVLLKYRVPAPRSNPYWGAYPQSPMALEDAQRTISLVRHRAAEWHINPHKIGVLGFSAGGHLVAAVSVHFNKRLYALQDAADSDSCRPNFAISLYPGHLSVKEGMLELVPDIATRIDSQTPITFLLQNENDSVDTVWDSLSYYGALVRAHVLVEFHSYAEGAHGFGLRRTKYPVTAWPTLVQIWLHTIGMVASGR